MKEKNKEIIAYRIGEGLFCPDCYEKGARTLKAVQDPNEPEVKFPSKAIKKGEIEGFVCRQCKAIMGIYKVRSPQELRDLQTKLGIPDEPEEKKPGEKRNRRQDDFTDLEDMMEDIFCKVHFIEDFLNPYVPIGEIFSDNGRTGFYHILIDLEDDIKFVQDGMSMIKNKEGRKDSDLAGSKIIPAEDGLLETIETARAAGKI